MKEIWYAKDVRNEHTDNTSLFSLNKNQTAPVTLAGAVWFLLKM